MKRQCRTAALVALFVGVSCGTARAATLTLDVAYRGFINSLGQTNPSGSPDYSGNNYLAGFCSGCQGGAEYRDWFQFDIPDFAGTVVAARLWLHTADIDTPDPEEVYLVTSLPALRTFASLGMGVPFGSRSYGEADSFSFLSLQLNDAALESIIPNTAFGLSGRVSSLSGGIMSEFVFGGSYGYPSYLEVEIVPEPTTVVFLVAGIAVVVCRQRRSGGPK